MAKKKVIVDEAVEDLIIRANRALQHAKMEKKKAIPCKQCKTGKPYYRGLCTDCDQLRKQGKIDEKNGKRWISTNGHEYCYTPDGNPTLYAPFRMAQILGRPLQGHESVGRLDGDKTNNSDDNLILVAKPGINLMELKCDCGKHYFTK